jgi:ABC-type dipeptide/oligopeptide/nickel transport system permease subunit
MTRLIALVVIVWLVIGAIAAGQRGYYGGNNDTSCAQAGDTVVTIVAGPLNYFGVNPKVSCHVPQPSK